MTVSLPKNALATVETRAAKSVQQMGIELLLDLAKQGEIDPWDVQVIEAIDRFLSQTMPMSEAAQREAALSQSGQAFLCASMLVWLKAESLLRSPSLEEEEPEFIEEEQESDGENAVRRVVPMHLERQLRRRAVAQPPQKRRVSLQELLEQLQLIAKAMEENPRRRRSQRLLSNKSGAQTVKAITHLAHQENLSEMAASLERFLAAHWHQIAQEREWLEFEQLLSLLPDTALPESDIWASTSSGNEPAPKSNDKVGIFWALLLLSAQSKVELSQEEFYEDLKIRALPEGLQATSSSLMPS
ncbi:MAG: segregation/condensation protein A [Oscillatoriaceae bacterium SKW80]|nr:segregation/condensation protein A [Oscillatoriaceae bacterium SKYG93]MCX8119241.1 segregation/condensation protein A [Oscillatoriaceae bacterium SKW80]MDW8454708.1 segregation/condensation protein A [Oscillatoriaceae cyanobacterium SKYGB_i_bin93]HIK28512.1 segregation/condensation protein A [Oscillatoriaceae cyanobacterium M7585_C2015_266]